jgi:acetyltransferase-like isoleucine patch superfamily enzyme
MPAEHWLHPQSLCESTAIGKGTRVGAFSYVHAGATIGRDCDIGDSVLIENDVVLGDGVTVKNGVQLWDGLRVGRGVFIGPNTTFTNGGIPLDIGSGEPVASTLVESGASLGGNCTILAGVHIGRHATVEPGAVVIRNVPPNAVVAGNPACIIGYSDTSRIGPDTPAKKLDEALQASSVRGVSIHRLPLVHDMRGDLTVGEFNGDVPFDVARYFVVFNVPSPDVRGEHAHRVCRQFLICVHGECAVVVDDGTSRAEIALHQPNVGLLLPPMVWATQYKFSADAVLLVFASHPYDPGDYIRDFEEFLAEVGTTFSPR